MLLFLVDTFICCSWAVVTAFLPFHFKPCGLNLVSILVPDALVKEVPPMINLSLVVPGLSIVLDDSGSTYNPYPVCFCLFCPLTPPHTSVGSLTEIHGPLYPSLEARFLSLFIPAVVPLPIPMSLPPAVVPFRIPLPLLPVVVPLHIPLPLPPVVVLPLSNPLHLRRYYF